MAIEHLAQHELLRSLGLTRRYRGYDFLIDTLVWAREDAGLLDAPTKQLYPVLAKRYHTTSAGVDGALRTAARVCWTYGDPARTGRQSPDQPPPTVREMLRLLASLDREGQA